MAKKPKPKNSVSFRMTEDELRILRDYCTRNQCQQSEVFREFVKSLASDNIPIGLVTANSPYRVFDIRKKR